MKNTLQTLFFATILLACNSIMRAQVMQVSVGPGYGQQAYLKLSTGEVTAVANDAWDIAFTDAGGFDAGLLINESGSLGGASLELYKTDLIEWDATISDPSVYAIEQNRLYNTEQNWTSGAFNAAADPTDDFDYGWGSYNVATHTIEGTTIYIIKERSGSFKRFQMINLVGGVYNFHYANIDGSNEQSASISKGGGQPLMYFSMQSNDEVNAPADYDIVFQRYTTPLDAGGGDILEYMVTGVLLASGTQAVVADGIDPTSVNYDDYEDQLASDPTVIGHEWKNFDFTTGWAVDEDRAQFVKTAEGNVYKIVFYDFEGSTTGITTLESTFIEFSSSEDVESEVPTDGVSIYPNPAIDATTIQASISFDRYEIMNEKGQVVKRGALTNNQLRVDDMAAGQYIVHLISPEASHWEKLQVVK